MKLSLPPSLASPAALNRCLEEFKEYREALQERQLAERSAGTAVRTTVKGLSHAATELLGAAPNPARPDAATIDEAITFLEGIQAQAPVVHVTTVVELTTEDQQKVSHWFWQLTQSIVLTAFSVNPQQAGGVVVRTPDHIHDYSFATRLNAQSATVLQGLQRG